MKRMRNLPLFSCLVESYGYNFIHLRFSALCCGCHRAFGSRQIKCTCSSHPQPGCSAAQPPLRTDPEVLVVFLAGQRRERHLVINRLIRQPNLFFFFIVIMLYNLFCALALYDMFHLAVFSFATLHRVCQALQLRSLRVLT